VRAKSRHVWIHACIRRQVTSTQDLPEFEPDPPAVLGRYHRALTCVHGDSGNGNCRWVVTAANALAFRLQTNSPYAFDLLHRADCVRLALQLARCVSEKLSFCRQFATFTVTMRTELQTQWFACLSYSRSQLHKVIERT
jgi:hypothetical protein